LIIEKFERGGITFSKSENFKISKFRIFKNFNKKKHRGNFENHNFEKYFENIFSPR